MPEMEVRVLGMISNCCSMALSKILTCFSKAHIEVIETAIAWFTELFTVIGKGHIHNTHTHWDKHEKGCLYLRQPFFSRKKEIGNEES